MKASVTAALLVMFLLTAAGDVARADDYFENAFSPEGADDRSSQLYPAYDFEDVIFTREYFYTLEEGRAQTERSGGTWKALDFDLGIFGGGKNEEE
jgi:hypothetical protein